MVPWGLPWESDKNQFLPFARPPSCALSLTWQVRRHVRKEREGPDTTNNRKRRTFSEDAAACSAGSKRIATPTGARSPLGKPARDLIVLGVVPKIGLQVETNIKNRLAQGHSLSSSVLVSRRGRGMLFPIDALLHPPVLTGFPGASRDAMRRRRV